MSSEFSLLYINLSFYAEQAVFHLPHFATQIGNISFFFFTFAFKRGGGVKSMTKEMQWD